MTGVTNEQFLKDIKENNIVVVDFFATWCGPCQMYYPVFSDAAKKVSHKMIKVDIDKERELAMKWGIQSIPTTIVIKDGKEINRIMGYQTESQLISWIKTVAK